MHILGYKNSGPFDTDHKRRNTLPIVLICFLAVAVILICLVRTIIYSETDSTAYMQSEKNELNDIKSWNDGWTLEYDGKVVDHVTLPCTVELTTGGTVRLTRTITEETIPEAIEFDDFRQKIEVTTDQGTLYRINLSKIAEGMVFTDKHLIELPEDAHITELSLVFYCEENTTCQIPEIFCGSIADIRYSILENDLLTLGLLILFAVLILVMIVTGVFYAVRKENNARNWVLVIFLSLVFFWGLADSYLPIMFQVREELLGMIEYMAVFAMPIPSACFVWLSYGKKGRSLPFIIILGSLNVILEGVLSIFGILQLNKTFWTGHALTIITVAISVYNVIKERKKGTPSGEDNIIFFALIIQALTAVATVGTYWLIGGSIYRNVLLVGTLFFVFALFGAVIYHSVQEKRQEEIRHSEQQISERFSKYDQLTGLKNRRAYEEKLEDIDKNWDKDAVLVMMDVNGLKITNDIYGHASGDDLVVSAAKIIADIYKAENCYRIGGDEFVAILTDMSKAVTSYEEELEQAVEQANEGTVWKLSIAQGASYLLNPAGKRLSISDWKMEADVKMYQNKIACVDNGFRAKAQDLSDIIDCIITTLEAKDSYTAYHSDRVREISVCIGHRLGLSANTIATLETAAHMHDIGKVGVPDRVLSKPGPLTDEEYELMKRHSAIGAEILSKAKSMKDIATIVLHHHERYDGKGYPDGIAGDDIPIESRIIAIADSIDAMTSKRVYRNSMSIDECRKEIERNQGIMYDPAISRIVLENWKDIQDIILLHPKRLGV